MYEKQDLQAKGINSVVGLQYKYVYHTAPICICIYTFVRVCVYIM